MPSQDGHLGSKEEAILDPKQESVDTDLLVIAFFDILIALMSSFGYISWLPKTRKFSCADP
jgi:hypothetical protein